MTSLSEKSLELLQAKRESGIKVFKDLDIMIPLGLSFPVVSDVIKELEENGYIDVDHRYVNSRFTLV
ncbi:MAG: RecX family transcriptional regulator [Lachnospiraceae bacterium]|nr:RecX family transcriptional regulator [Lachnospiraceae bacterium]